MKKLLNFSLSVLEYGLAVAFFNAAHVVFNSTPILVAYPGAEVVTFIYGTWLLILGLMLIAAKIFDWDKGRKFVLMAMYLTVIHFLLLNIAMHTATVYILDDAIMGIAAALLWLKLKLSCDYVRIKDI